MLKKFSNKFSPNCRVRNKEKDCDMCNPYYMEVSDLCYLHPGLKKKDDVLVYSALSSGFNNSMYDITDFSSYSLGRLLNMHSGEIEKSINRLVNLGLISVSHFTNGKENIKVNVDLRYPDDTTLFRRQGNSPTKIYYRMFSYPLITKTMIHLYAYYWKLSRSHGYMGFSYINYKEVAEALGYSEKQISNCLEKMEDMGLIKIDKRLNAVFLKVDFGQEQPEEIKVNQKLLDYSIRKREEEFPF